MDLLAGRAEGLSVVSGKRCPVNRDHQAKWTECLINARHLGQISSKPDAGLPTSVLNDKGRYHSLIAPAFPQRGEYAPHFLEADAPGIIPGCLPFRIFAKRSCGSAVCTHQW
jgi:hypothetical protein